MAATKHRRVGQALGLLSRGLTPFVARECQSKYGERWLAAVTRMDPGRAHDQEGSTTDAQFLLGIRRWFERSVSA